MKPDIAAPASGKVHFAMQGEIAVLTIDNPPVNAGSHGVRKGIVEGIAAAEEKGAKAAILVGAGRCFVAGSDLKEFGKPLLWPELPDVIATIENASFPVVAALHGVALGGGLELALGCDYRISTPDTKVGLPEVSLGFVPGAGGTQRLPRLVGISKAIDLICRAARIPAQEAFEIGLLDRVADGDIVAAALDFLAEGRSKRIAKSLTPPTESVDLIDASAAKMMKRGKSRRNVAEAIRLVKASTGDADTVLKDERAVFQELRLSDDAVALRYLFFSERKAAAIEDLDMSSALPIGKVGVIGGGTMGQGIARAFLAAGLPVVLVERHAESLAAAMDKTLAGIDKLESSGRVSKDEAAAQKNRLSGTVAHAELAGCDLVIEAVFEDMAIKKEVMSQLEESLPASIILATNTSYLDINDMTADLSHPERVLGLHFFSPADVMKLLEVVRADRTSDQTLATGLKLARKLGKQPVVAKVGEGFIGNRIYAAYRRRAELLVLDGASPEAVDKAAADFGFAMGPFAVSDMSGLDIAWAMRKRQAANRDPKARYVTIPDRLCEAGRLGRKTGKGWYDYSSGKAQPDPEVTALIETARADADVLAQNYSAEQIQLQLMAAIVNEAACLLEDGIALRASDVDVAFANGYGFPRWRGGPLYWASRQDRSALLAELDVLAEAIGHGFRAGPVHQILDQIDTPEEG